MHEKLHDGLAECARRLHIGKVRCIELYIAGLVDVVDLIERDANRAVAAHYVLVDFSARWQAGKSCAGSDVAGCGWFAPADALALVAWAETRRIIRASARELWQLEL